MEFQEFEQEFRRQLAVAPHQRLKALSKMISAMRKQRFNEGTHARKIELVERGFTEEEFNRFMFVVTDLEDQRCFIFMAVLGLRVGELLALKGKDITGDELRVNSAKGSYSAMIRLPSYLLSILPPKAPEEPLFGRTRKELSDHFALYRAKSGLDDVYLMTAPCGQSRTRNRRYRLSLHSLRFFAINRVYSATKDPDLARRFARHKHMVSTERYLRSTRKDEVERIIGLLAQPFQRCISIAPQFSQ